MKHLLQAALAALWLLFAANGARADMADEAERQVLVLLPMPAPHYRPDSAYAGSYVGAGQAARRAAARDLARRHGLALVTDWPLPELGIDCYVMTVPAGQDVPAAAEALATDPRVSWAQPMNVYAARAGGHDDPLFATQPAAQEWQLADWHRVTQGRGVSVAVIDSGVDTAHPDLAGRVALARNLVDDRPLPAETHGTAVAGLVGARADDGVGIAGIAPAARLLALRACQGGTTTRCTTLALAKGLHAALAAGADIVNLSVAGPPDRLLARLLDHALTRGASVVAAVDPALPGGGFPASHPGVLAVSDVPAPNALVAPGHDLPAPLPGGRWGYVSGSSYAAAQVSGLLALLRELGTRTLEGGSQGRIDACAALARASGRAAAPCTLALTAPRP